MLSLSRVRRIAPSAPFLIPLLSFRVPGGFPSPAEEYEEESVDLNRLLMGNPTATYLMTVEGHSVSDFGVHDGHLVVVDASAEPMDKDIVVARLDGQLTIKRIRFRTGALRGRAPVFLEAGSGHANIELAEVSDLVVQGVVTASLWITAAQKRLGGYGRVYA
jgi:DNA polymerase V